MASMAEEDISCPICLNALKDPATLPCGHNFCLACIRTFWAQKDTHAGAFSCPQCRRIFPLRPELSKNVMLADMVKKMENMGHQASQPVGLKEVSCDMCPREQVLWAVKSCLVCLVSYCQSHLEPHLTLPALQGHQLVDATGCVREKICPRHNRVLEIYCQQDDECICYLCTMDDHEGHDTILASEVKAQREDSVTEAQQHFKHKLYENELELQELIQAMESLTKSAQDLRSECDKHFGQLVAFIQQQCSETKKMIQEHEQVALRQAERIKVHLDKRVTELRDSVRQWESLSHTQDPVFFLQGWQCLQTPCEEEEPIVFDIQHNHTFWDIKKSLVDMKTRVEGVCREETVEISERVIKVQVLAPPCIPSKNPEPQRRKVARTATDLRTVRPMNREPFRSMKYTNAPKIQTRLELLQYSCQLKLDPNTVHANLCLLEENRKVMWKGQGTQRPFHPHRFDCWEQVLCTEPLMGARYYWEVDWTGEGVYIGVAYRSLGRKGRGLDCGLGCNTESWSLYCSKSGHIVWHNNQQTKVDVHSISPRIGVFLDHRAGSLAFFGVSHTMTRLFRFRTNFTKPLFSSFGVRNESSLKLCPMDGCIRNLV